MNQFKNKNIEATHETHSRSHIYSGLNVYLASVPIAFPTYTLRPINRERLHISRMK